MQEKAPTVNRKIQLGYASGNGFIGSPLPQFLGTFFSLYLTAVAGLTTAHMAVVASAASILDLFAIPIFSVSHTKSKYEAGEIRPWLLIGGLVCCLARYLSFTTFSMSEPSLFVWIMITHLISSFVFNLHVRRVYGEFNLVANTADSRIKISSYQIMFSGIFAILFSVFAVGIINAVGYNVMALIIVIITMGTSLFIYQLTKKVDVYVPKSEMTPRKRRRRRSPYGT
jgi:Na+/melibiose symporter-like transporter